MLDIEIKPTNDLTVDFSTFYSHMRATNYNRNWMFWGSHVINGGAGEMPTSYTVTNGTLTSAVFPNLGSPGNNHQYAIVDEIFRPGTYSETSFYDIDLKYRATNRLTFSGQLGYTRGVGKTPKQDVFEGDVFNTGATYTMHGISSATDVAFPNGNPSNFAGTSLDWIFGASPAKTEDKETYGQIDGLASVPPSTSAIPSRWRKARTSRSIPSTPQICRSGTARPTRATSPAVSAEISRALPG